MRRPAAAVVVMIMIITACASAPNGRWDRSRDDCASLVVTNRSWYDVVVRSSLRRLGDVTSMRTQVFEVCGHQTQPLLVAIHEIGTRTQDYMVFGHGEWTDGDSYTLEVANHHAHSVLRPSWETER